MTPAEKTAQRLAGITQEQVGNSFQKAHLPGFARQITGGARDRSSRASAGDKSARLKAKER